MHEGLGLLRLRQEIHLDYDGDRQAFLGTEARLTEDGERRAGFYYYRIRKI